MKSTQLSIAVLGLVAASCAEGTFDENENTDSEGTGPGPTSAPVSPTGPSNVGPSGGTNPEPAAPTTDSSAPPASGSDAGGTATQDDAGAPPVEGSDASTPQAPSDRADAATETNDGGDDTPAPQPPPCGGMCGEDEHCQPAANECVECLRDAHCGEDFICDDNACIAITPCENSEQCDGDAPVCHSELDRCVICEIDLDCPESETCENYRCVDPEQQCARGDDPCTASTIVPMSGSQEVDGLGDEFCDVPGFELNFANPARGAADLPHSALVRVAWSEDAFHLFAEVEDPDIATNSNIDSLWSGDVIELYLATSAASELQGFFTGRVDGVQLVFAPPTEDQPARAARLFWIENGNSGGWRQVREEFTQDFASRLTGSGYTMEARIPWSSFGPRAPEMDSGLQIAFNFGLATASSESMQNDAREGAALLFVGPPADGVATCDGEQLPWCNATTWCSPTLQ